MLNTVVMIFVHYLILKHYQKRIIFYLNSLSTYNTKSSKEVSTIEYISSNISIKTTVNYSNCKSSLYDCLNLKTIFGISISKDTLTRKKEIYE